MDTRITHEAIAGAVVQQTAEVFDAASRWFTNAGKDPGARFYRQMATWVRRRSPQNGLWLYALASTVLQTMQHGVARHLEPEDGPEYEEWEIVIDPTSVVQTPRNRRFWSEWLRNRVFAETTARPFNTVTEWTEDHPFRRRFERSGNQIDMGDVFRNHMHFEESAACNGLQIADVCASIVRRRFADSWFSPYERIRPRIVYKVGQGRVVVLHLDEATIRSEAPEAHLRFMNELPDQPMEDDDESGT